MSGSRRSIALRCLMMGSAILVLLSTLIAAPVFTHGSAAPIPLGSPAFAAQWNSIEATVPNFWGPAYQTIFPERYQEATGGQRLVQYFEKARMEQTLANGPVTNGLLTVELITGQRQFGDTTFTAYPPATIPVVGDPSNPVPTYAAFAASVLPAKVLPRADADGDVYNPDGTLSVDTQRAAAPGATFGSYQADPGGRFAHNIPLAFWSYLSTLPIPWQSAMGFPLTEAVWVSVTLKSIPTWVLVQPFERRVLSYTPTNPVAFHVEMGNIGQHYFQWRYAVHPGGLAGPATATPTPTAVPTVSATPLSTATGTATRQGVEILNFRQTGLTATTFSFAFQTNLPATSYIRYGTASGTYPNASDIATTQTTSHAATLTGLTPNTLYYFTIRVTSDVDAMNRNEDYFITLATQ